MNQENNPQHEPLNGQGRNHPKRIISIKWSALKYKLVLISIFIITAGIALLLTAHKFPSNIVDLVKEIGIALTAAGTVGITIDIFTRKQFEDIIQDSFASAYKDSEIPSKLDDLFSLVKMANNFRDLGIKNIYDERNDDRALEIIKEARKGSKIQLLGTCLRSFTGAATQKMFREKMQQGCTFELLVLNADSQFVDQRKEEEGETNPEIKNSIETTNRSHELFRNQLNATNLKNNIILEYYDAPPNLFLIITETIVLVGFYMRGNMGQFFPEIEIENKSSGISKSFIDHYDLLMKDSIAKNNSRKAVNNTLPISNP